MNIETPIVLIDGDDLLFFDDMESLLSYVEAIDVMNGEFSVFAANGDVIELGVRTMPYSFIGSRRTPVLISTERRADSRKQLRRAVMNYLLAREQPVDESSDLEGLVRFAAGR